MHLSHCPWAARRTESDELANQARPGHSAHSAQSGHRTRGSSAVFGLPWGGAITMTAATGGSGYTLKLSPAPATPLCKQIIAKLQNNNYNPGTDCAQIIYTPGGTASTGTGTGTGGDTTGGGAGGGGAAGG